MVQMLGMHVRLVALGEGGLHVDSPTPAHEAEYSGYLGKLPSARYQASLAIVYRDVGKG